jgi:tripartite-type tricarboxylate transporter receptor subunit TctC
MMSVPFRRHVIAATLVLLALGAFPLAAQDYPSKNIRVIVPFPAGGGTDVVARVVVPKIAEQLKHTMYVDNIGGASGSLGHEAVARAAPDGYTLLLATASTIATNPLISKVPWNPVNDFTPIGMITVDPMPLVVTPSLPTKNIQELIALAKAKPDTLTRVFRHRLGAASCRRVAQGPGRDQDAARAVQGRRSSTERPDRRACLADVQLAWRDRRARGVGADSADRIRRA